MKLLKIKEIEGEEASDERQKERARNEEDNGKKVVQ